MINSIRFTSAAAKMDLRSMISEKGNKLLLLNNFKFSKAHVAKCGKIRWRCINRKCSSKIYTSDDQITILEANLVHNHVEDSTLQRQQVSNTLKRKALDDLTERPSKLIQKELKVCTFVLVEFVLNRFCHPLNV